MKNSALTVVNKLAFTLALCGLVCLDAKAANDWGRKSGWSYPSTNNPISSADRSRFDSKRDGQSPFSPGSNNLSLDIGQVFLMGDLGDQYRDNLGGQLHYTYGVSEMFGFDSSIGYSGHSDDSFSMTSLLTGLRVNLSWYDRIIPYATFGLGFYNPSYKFKLSDRRVKTVSPILFGLHLGPGISLSISESIFFGTSLTFHDIFGGEEIAPNGSAFSVGGTYTTFLLHAGVSF